MNLTEERLNRGLSISAAAAEIGVNRMTLAAVERGERILPRNAKKVADFYGCKVTDVMPLDGAGPGTEADAA